MYNKLRKNIFLIILLIIGTVGSPVVYAADIFIPSGYRFDIQEASLELETEDISNAGSITASTGSILLGGDWINSGDFASGSSTVTLNSLTQAQSVTTGGTNSSFSTIAITNIHSSGASFIDALYCGTLTAASGVQKLSFGASGVHTISSRFNVNGLSGSAITLAPTAASTNWYLDAPETTVNYLNVSYSQEASGKTMWARNSVDGGNNANWIFLAQPTVSTGAASNVSMSTAILSANVNANGTSTTSWFQYGVSSGSYGNSSSSQAVSGTSTTYLTMGISGLSSNTQYYYRAVAQNNEGATYGSENSFTTPSFTTVAGSFDRNNYFPSLNDTNDFDRAWISVTDPTANTSTNIDTITVTVKAGSNSISFVLKETGGATSVFTTSGLSQPVTYPIGTASGYCEDFIGSHSYPVLGLGVTGLNLNQFVSQVGGNAGSGISGKLNVSAGDTLVLLHGGSTLDTAPINFNTGAIAVSPSVITLETADSPSSPNVAITITDPDENLNPLTKDVIGFTDGFTPFAGSPGTGTSRVSVEAVDVATGSRASVGGIDLLSQHIMMVETGANTGIFSASGKIFNKSSVASNELYGNIRVGSSTSSPYSGQDVILGDVTNGPGCSFKIIELTTSGRIGLYEADGTSTSRPALGFTTGNNFINKGISSFGIQGVNSGTTTRVVAINGTQTLFGHPAIGSNYGTTLSGLHKLIEGNEYCLVDITNFKGTTTTRTGGTTYEIGNGGSVTASIDSFQLAGVRYGDSIRIRYLEEFIGAGISGTSTGSTGAYNAPVVATGSSTGVTMHSAMLTGTVNPNGTSTTVWFQYGKYSGSYSDTTSSQSIGGTSTTGIQAFVNNLTPYTTYYCRIVSQNGMGTTYGSETSFSTIPGVAGGGFHSIGLRSDSTAWAWGGNWSGQLGNGQYLDSNAPVQVSGLSSASKTSCGWSHSLGLKSDGTVWAWGDNNYGQLGNGTTTSSTALVQASGLSSISNIASGDDHSLALKSDGTVWAWGHNSYGQLGNGTTTSSSLPVQVSGLSNIVDIADGSYYSLALKSDGTVWAWGGNYYGQLGNGTTTDSKSPVQVNNLSGVVDIEGSYDHSLALKSDGTVWAWGDNYYGQLGNGTTAASTQPVQVSGLNNVIDIVGGVFYSIALKSDGTVWAWGDNKYGQLGVGASTLYSTIPVQVTGLTGVVDISGGDYHSLALKSDGTIWAWGDNDYGQLGIGVAHESTMPVQTSGLSGITAISAGVYHSLARKSDNTVWAWGQDYFGQLGDGSFYVARNTPVQVSSISGTITALAGGEYHSLALKSDGAVLSWGANWDGQLGNGTITDSNVSVSVSGINNINAVNGGWKHSLALKSDGTVWTWGDNYYGQLGNGTNTDSSVPVQTIGLSGTATAVASGGAHSLAITSDNTVWTWGYNSSGQLGNGTTTSGNTPVQVSGLSGTVTAVTGGWEHSIALKSDGTVWVWGGNSFNQLGNGTTTSGIAPIQVSSLNGSVTAVAGGHYHTLALKSDNTVWAWGGNWNGQLGNGTTTSSSVPVQVSGLSGTITAIAAGYSHSLAQKADGTVWAWGDNLFGELGNGIQLPYTPTQVTSMNTKLLLTASTGAATSVSTNSATLNGSVNANGITTSAWFEYGNASGSYTGATTAQTVSGTTDTAISASLSSLSQGATYYYRTVAQNSLGTIYGGEVSFTTSTPPSSGGGGGGGGSVSAPTPSYISVNSTSPSSGATNVAVTTAISATFSASIDSSTVSSGTFKVTKGGSSVGGSLSTSGSTVTFTPTSNFSNNTTYTVTITTGIKPSDTSKSSLSSEYSWSFTTTATSDTTAPSCSLVINSGSTYTTTTGVTLALSATDDTGVTGYYVTTTGSSTPSSSDSGWISVASTGTYSASVSYTLSSGDGEKTVYAFYKDAAGNISSGASDSITLDTTAPTVSSTNPANNATTVSVNDSLSATFSENLDSSTIGTSTFTFSGFDVGSITYSSATVTITPKTTLSYRTTYTGTVTTGVKDVAGNPMASSYEWKFTTTGIADTTAPGGSLVINSGRAYATATGVTLALSATDDTGVTGYYITTTGSSTPSSTDSAWVSVTSTGTYSASVSYTLSSGDGEKTVYAFYKDAAGNISSVASDAITLDTTAPTVSSTNPANNATNVSVNDSLTATFSENLDSSTIGTSTFTFSGFDVGTITYSGATVTITPQSTLSYRTTYTGTITTGVKDVAGNTMASNYGWRFTTQAFPDTTVPVGTLVINGGNEYTTTNGVTLALSATDAVGVTEYYISTGSSTPSSTDSQWTSGASSTFFSANVSYVLGSGDGNKTVYAFYKDAAGNISRGASDSIILDSTSPSVVSTDPAKYASSVAINAVLTATFSENLDSSTLGTSTFTFKDFETGTITYSGTTVSITPKENLKYFTTYTGTITNGIKDRAGNPMASSYGWSFTTAKEPVALVADFTADPVAGKKPLAVQFTDTSTGDIASWKWDFGDGSSGTEQNQQNPKHTYTGKGKYTVSLKITGKDGKTDKKTVTDYINVTGTNELTAAFSGSPTEGDTPLTVTFTDQSVGSATSWNWDFGDKGTSKERNPTYVYQSEGKYTVTLSVSDGETTSKASIEKYIKANKPVVPLVVDFSADPLSGKKPLTVNFKDLSTGDIESRKWDFGDGETSADKNPGHKYKKQGEYTVSLKITGKDGSSKEKAVNNYITVTKTDKLTAGFTASPTSGDVPLAVRFTDKTTGGMGVTKWEWNFGDKTTSTEQNPSHKYSEKGVYTVSLTVSDGEDVDTKTIEDYIDTKGPEPSPTPTPTPVDPPVANFAGDPTTGVKPLKVRFTDMSTGEIESWKWDFGDGSASSERDPEHKYSEKGEYTVSLKVKNAGGSDTKTIEKYITVTKENELAAGFIASPVAGDMPLTAQFTDQSVGSGITSWSWSFGDGGSSKDQNPSYQYSTVGEYTVSLTVTDKENKSNTKTIEKYIGVTNTIDAEFFADKTEGEWPLEVQFTDQCFGIVTGYEWDFGDGSGESGENPKHTYEKSGNYTVVLTAKGPGGTSNTETKTGYIIVSKKPSQITVSAVPKEITFGESVALSGYITPAFESAVTLSFGSNYGRTAAETVSSGEDGSFTMEQYYPPAGGMWEAVASWEGNDDYSGAESDSQEITVNPAVSSFTIAPSASTVYIDQTVTFSGTVTLTPDNEVTRNEFKEDYLKLIRINPEEEYEDVFETQPYPVDDHLEYAFTGVKLPVLGEWEILTGFDKDESFNGALTAGIIVTVQDKPKDTAGYAIIVEGRTKGDYGLESHNRTTNYAYNRLKNRGFADDTIYYFNYDNTQSGVDEKPSHSGVTDAIKTWASGRMNNSPAPLYIILVGHGKNEKFLIHSDSNITAGDLSGALDTLESKLNEEAQKEPIVIVIGANRSGSFIKPLSKSGTNRVIITSCDSEEVAYKGPLPPGETVRHGDFFVKAFMKNVAKGNTVKRSYERAAEKIAEYTENESGNGLNGASAGNGQYFDESAQHPLLEDNGDGRGTFKTLSSNEGEDGAISSDIVAGTGSETTSLEITKVSEAVSLEADDEYVSMYATVNDASLVDTIWIEVASSGHTLKNNKDETIQQEIDLPQFSYTSFGTNTYTWDDFTGATGFYNFEDAGSYRALYFAREKETEAIAPFMATEVFRSARDNAPPTAFNPVFPTKGTDTAVALTFEWEESADPDTDEDVTYTLTIAKDASFETIQYQKKKLTTNYAIVDKTASLMDGTTYYWKVLASDVDGGTTQMGTETVSGETSTPTPTPTPTLTPTVTPEVRNQEVYWYAKNEKAGDAAIENITASAKESASSFTASLSNGYPGFIKGYVFDKESNAGLAKATVDAKGIEGSYKTTDTGSYIMELDSGEYTVSGDASGYVKTSKIAKVESLTTTERDIGLPVDKNTASVIGQVTDKKSGDALEGITVTLKKKSFKQTTTTDSEGRYSFTELESGTYKLSAKMSGYKKYTKNKLKVKANSEKTQNIKMSTKK